MVQNESDVLIVGAGAAGHSAAVTLRRSGFDGSIRIIHDEPFAPYNRTLVSKGILPGLLTPEQAALPALDSSGVELIHGHAAGMEERSLRMQDGREYKCRVAVVATGSTPQSVRGADTGSGIFSLHSASDGVRIRESVGSTFAGRTVTVLGAGLVGAEAASFFAGAGTMVHLVARSDIPLARTLGVPIATRLRDLHAAHTDFLPGRTVRSVTSSGSGIDVLLDDGRSVMSDLAVVAHGTIPAASWVDLAGSAVDVDDRLRSKTMPGVYAAGGVARHTGAGGRTYRLDH